MNMTSSGLQLLLKSRHITKPRGWAAAPPPLPSMVINPLKPSSESVNQNRIYILPQSPPSPRNTAALLDTMLYFITAIRAASFEYFSILVID